MALKLSNTFRTKTTLFIDFDGTIVDYRQNEIKALLALMEPFKLDNKKLDQFISAYQRINTQLWGEYRKQKITVDILRVRRFELALEEAQIKNITAESLSVKYLEHFIDNVEIDSSIYKKLEKLKNNNFKIYILTNGFESTQNKRIDRLKLNRVIDGYVTSERAGKAKPDPAMFQLAMREANSRPEETVMIGDSFEADILGANQQRIFGIHLSEEEPQVVNEWYLSTKNLDDALDLFLI